MSVLFELKDHVGVITIDRQEALNALNRQTLAGLKNVINGPRPTKMCGDGSNHRSRQGIREAQT